MKIIKQTLHDRKRNRLLGYDYSQDGLYFVTFYTRERINYFGGIHNEIMCINKLGRIVWEQWQWLAGQYPYIVLHDFVVMPNHVHGIIQIDSSHIKPYTGGSHIDGSCTDRSRPVPIAQPINKSYPNVSFANEGGSQPAPTANDAIKIKPLSELIGALKTTSSKYIHHNGFENFKWQRSFYDHIIRDEKSFFAIQNYINKNPAKWWRDRNNF
ncbi:MAG: transposase [Candidatus Magasanikbacteria bacterium]